MGGRKWKALLCLLVTSCVTMATDNQSNEEANATQAGSQNDIEFSLPDLVVYVDDDEGHSYLLRGYRSTTNGQNDGNMPVPMLNWVSLGHPHLSKTPTNGNYSQLFTFKQNSFYTNVTMLTNEQRQLLAAAANAKYTLNGAVTSEQIHFLKLKNFTCEIQFIDGVAEYKIKGNVTNFGYLMFRVIFLVNRSNPDRQALIRLLDKSTKAKQPPDLDLQCSAESTGVSETKSTFALRSEQIQELDIEDQLFGNADSVYVTRYQMSNLTANIYASLDVLEQYDVDGPTFEGVFVEDLITKVCDGEGMKMQSIDDVLSAMSKYSVDFKGDLKPNTIKSDLSSILKVDKVDGYDRIVVDTASMDRLQNELKLQVEGSSSATFLGISVGGTFSYGFENAMGSESRDTLLVDQLKKLNAMSEKDIKWEFQGKKIVPKELNVAKMQKASFKNTLEFQRISVRKEDASFAKKTTIYTSRIKRNRITPLGTTYTRWGSDECPHPREQLYSGAMTGGHDNGGKQHHNSGGGYNYLCLPSDLQTSTYRKSSSTRKRRGFKNKAHLRTSTDLHDDSAYLYYVSYSLRKPLTTQLNNHLAACSVCYMPNTAATQMIPGRTECPPHWNLCYSGLLAGARLFGGRTQTVCVDREPRNVSNTVADLSKSGVLHLIELNNIDVRSDALYPDGNEIPCVVCSN